MEESKVDPVGSGIIGKTVVDKGYPLGTADSSPFVAIEADIVVQRVGSLEMVAQIRTEKDGSFSVELEPGSYRLTATNTQSAPVPTARPVDVKVGSDAYTNVEIAFDSGVRGGP